MKLQVTESVQNLALYLVQVFCKFLKIFKVCRMFEKVAEHRSRVPPLAKTASLLVVRAQMAGCLKKLLCGPLERRRHLVTTRKASFKTLYINHVLREQTRL